MRDGGGGPDPFSANGNSCNIKVDGMFSDSANGMPVETIWNDLVSQSNPGRITTAGDTYSSVGGTLSAQADSLLGHAQRLAGIWGGTTASDALKQLGQLHETASNLGSASSDVGTALQIHGPGLADYKGTIKKLYDRKQALKNQLQGVLNQLKQYENPLTGLIDLANPVKGAGDAFHAAQLLSQASDLHGQMSDIDRQAQQQMNQLSTFTVGTYDALPGTVTKNLPPT